MSDWQPYFRVVFNHQVMWVTEFSHSGVLSPAITLDPQYRNEYAKRRRALTSLIRQMHDYPLAKRAVQWVADYERRARLRQIARHALRKARG